MPKVGDVVAGKYRLEKVAGEGGMGIVYAAEHLVLRQRVAVKVLLPDAATSDAVVERFAREAQAAARILSEHVARVMDAGSTASGAPFLVMEYLEGCDLEELLALQGPLPLAEVVDYMLQALEALGHAHAVGIVHRDMKPANLFLACRPDGGNVIKILDFGISKALKSSPEEKVLTGQAVLGSPVYMSPEQLRNAKEIDPRADLWSLGVVAYEMLAGRPPFDGDGVGEIFAAILEKDAEPLHHRNWRLPPELSTVIAKCLQRKPEERWQDAASLARALVPYGSGAWNGVVERIEQVLARAKTMTVEKTPSEARRVVDALVAAAERARTTGGGTAPVLLTNVKASAPEPEAPRLPADVTDTREDGLKTRAQGAIRRMPASRWLALAAAAAVAVAAMGAFAAVRARTPAAAPQAPAPLTAQNGPTGPTDPDPDEPIETSASPASEDPDAPMVMDLPDTPGHTGGAPRSRHVKPGKPQRPKFLNTRE
ncbi:MAG: serine/threonine protein kinase [Labilithrix sp.]|nr:serine/threonine protein kinase [Labilithrix sp.]